MMRWPKLVYDFSCGVIRSSRVPIPSNSTTLPQTSREGGPQTYRICGHLVTPIIQTLHPPFSVQGIRARDTACFLTKSISCSAGNVWRNHGACVKNNKT